MSQGSPKPAQSPFSGAHAPGLRRLRLRNPRSGERHEKDARPPLPGRRLPAPERARVRDLAVVPQAGVPQAADPDRALVASAQAGEVRAFEQLLRKYQQRILKLVGRLVGEADAPDVAQDTFVKIHRALPSFRGQSTFYTWLYRIAINTAKNHLVSRRRRPAAQDIDIGDARLEQGGDLCHHETPEAVTMSWEMRDQLAAVIGRLPADLKRAILLRELEGLSYEQMAQAMDCPLGTVRSRLFRAREAVESAFGGLRFA